MANEFAEKHSGKKCRNVAQNANKHKNSGIMPKHPNAELVNIIRMGGRSSSAKRANQVMYSCAAQVAGVQRKSARDLFTSCLPSPFGKRILVHELIHVVQQKSASKICDQKTIQRKTQDLSPIPDSNDKDLFKLVEVYNNEYKCSDANCQLLGQHLLTLIKIKGEIAKAKGSYNQLSENVDMEYESVKNQISDESKRLGRDEAKVHNQEEAKVHNREEAMDESCANYCFQMNEGTVPICTYPFSSHSLSKPDFASIPKDTPPLNHLNLIKSAIDDSYSFGLYNIILDFIKQYIRMGDLQIDAKRDLLTWIGIKFFELNPFIPVFSRHKLISFQRWLIEETNRIFKPIYDSPIVPGNELPYRRSDALPIHIPDMRTTAKGSGLKQGPQNDEEQKSKDQGAIGLFLPPVSIAQNTKSLKGTSRRYLTVPRTSNYLDLNRDAASWLETQSIEFQDIVRQYRELAHSSSNNEDLLNRIIKETKLKSLSIGREAFLKCIGSITNFL